jgi:hypothetical protein
MEKQFEIRTYGFNELAQLYFPNITPKSASQMFGVWIKTNTNLSKCLQQQNWKKGLRYLTPKQVKTIISHLDPP